MTELAIRETGAVTVPSYIPASVTERDVIDGWISVLGEVGRLADYIAETDFVPAALRNKPAAVAACILTGRELGIGPMQSLKVIHMIKGTPSLSAEYKRARALAAGHEIVIDDTNATRCVIRGRRAGTDRWVTITWTIDMARRAKLAARDIWQAYPQRMLQARASSELCDLLFPDASLGLATTEVLEDGGIVTAEGAVIDAATGEVASASETPAIEAPRPRTAQRRTRTQTAPSAQPHPPAATPAPAIPPAGQDADGALPPLPGEEDAPGPDKGTVGTVSTGPGAQDEPDDRDYDTPGTATTPQKTAIWTVLSQVYGFGKEEKDQARAVCAHIVQRDLASSSDLSKNEAKAVLDTLGHWQQQAAAMGEHPRDYLIAVMVAQDTADGEASDGQ